MKAQFLISMILFLNLSQSSIAQNQELIDAIKRSNLSRVTELVKQGADVNQKDENGATSLMWAAYKGTVDMVKFLVDSGADPMQKGIIPREDDPESWLGNLTGIAANNRDLRLLKYFIEECNIPPFDREYDPLTQEDSGWSAIEYAALFSDKEIINYLAQYDSPLAVLIRNKKKNELATGDEGLMRKLLIKNIVRQFPEFVNLKDKQNRTVYHLAAIANYSDIIDFLVTINSNIDEKDEDGYTPLHYSAKYGYQECLSKFIRLGAAINSLNLDNKSPLISAVYAEDSEVVKTLHTLGATLDLKNKAVMQIIDLAKPDIKEFLLNPKVDLFVLLEFNLENRVIQELKSNPDQINIVNNEGYSLFHQAVYLGFFELSKFLISSGVEINQKDNKGNTALMLAAIKNHVTIANLLLSNQALVNSSNEEGFTALHFATQHESPELTKLLINKGAKFNSKTKQFAQTPLLFAAYSNRAEVVRVLIEAGVQINYSNAKGHNALHSAIHGYSISIAHLNKRTHDQMEWLAAKEKINDRHLATIRTLTTNGLNIHGKDASGINAIELSSQIGFAKVTEWLKNNIHSPVNKSIPENNVIKKRGTSLEGAKVKIPLGHSRNSTVASIDVSNDGRYLISGGSDKRFIIWDLLTGLELARLKMKNSILKVRFLPDNKHFIIATNNLFDNISVWNFNSGNPVQKATLRGHGYVITGMQITADGSKIITSSLDKSVKVWDISNEDLLKSQENESEVLAMAISQDSKFVAFATRNNSIKLWNIHSNQIVKTFHEHHHQIFSVALSPDGEELASTDSSGRVIIRNLKTGKLNFDQIQNSQTINTINYSNDGRFISLGINILDALTKKSFKILNNRNGGYVSEFKWSPDSKWAYTANSQSSIEVWDTDSGLLIHELKGNTEIARSELIDNHHLLTTTLLAPISIKSNIKVWDLSTGEATVVHTAPNNHVYTALAISKNKKLIAIAHDIMEFDDKFGISNKYNIEIRNIPNLELLTVLEGHKGIIHDIDFSPDSKYLVSGAGTIPGLLNEECSFEDLPILLYNQMTDNDIHLWEIEQGKLIGTLKGHENAVQSVRFSPNGEYIVSGSMDQTSKLWEVKSRELLKSIRGGFPAIFINNGTQVATRGDMTELKIWTLSNHEIESFSLGTNSFLNSLDFSATKGYLAAGMYSGESCIWDVSKNKLIQSRNDHSAPIHTLRFMSGTNRFVSSAYDGTLKIKDFENDKIIVTCVPISQKDWIFYTPDLYYKSSKAATRNLGFSIGPQTYTFDQFDVNFNRPDIILTRMGYASESLINLYKKSHQKRLTTLGLKENPLTNETNIPAIKLVSNIPLSANEKSLSINYEVDGKGSTIHSIALFINDAPIKTITFDKVKKSLIRDNIKFDLSSGQNHISLVATSRDGIRSHATTFKINYTKQGTLPDIYILAIGAEKYRNSTFNLKYPKKDAQDIVQLFQQKASAYKNIYTRIFTGESVTRSNILALKKWLQQTKIDDKVILFYAGHGIRDENADLYFGGYDLNFQNPSEHGISYPDLENLLSDIPARQKLLLIDACFAGELEKEGITLNSTSPSEHGKIKFRSGSRSSFSRDTLIGSTFDLMKAHFIDLRQNTGTVVIAAAGATQVALESDKWKNGAFTSCIIDLLNNPLTNTAIKDQLTISELQNHILENVPLITEYEQYPIVRREHINYDWRIW